MNPVIENFIIWAPDVIIYLISNCLYLFVEPVSKNQVQFSHPAKLAATVNYCFSTRSLAVQQLNRDLLLTVIVKQTRIHPRSQFLRLVILYVP